MRFFLYFTFVLMFIVTSSCGLLDGSEPEINENEDPDEVEVTEPTPFEGPVSWSDLGLDGIPVHDLEIYGNNLYTATDEGVFKTMIHSSDIQWELLGLDSDTTRVSAIEPLSNGDLLAVVEYKDIDITEFDPSDIPQLFRSSDGGSTWDSDLAMQLEGIEQSPIMLLKKQNEESETLFAYRNEILRSDDNGKSWHRFPDFDYSDFFLEENALSLRVNPFNPNQVWYGGSDPQGITPINLVSDDGGITWEMRSGPSGSGGVQDIVFSSDDTDVIASIGGKIGITDGSTSPVEGVEDFEWTIVYDREKHVDILDLAIFTMQNSQELNSRVYASGRLWEGSGNLSVLLTEDFGEQWQYTVYEGSPEDVRTNDMVVADVNGNERLFLATDKGVFGFTID